MDFFRIVTLDVEQTSHVIRSVVEEGTSGVIAELGVALVVGLVVCILCKLVPVAWERGSFFVSDNQVHTKHVSTKEARQPPPVQHIANETKTVDAIKSVPAVTRDTASQQTVAAESAATTAAEVSRDASKVPVLESSSFSANPPSHHYSSHKHHHEHTLASPIQDIDLDAVLDEFCDEEDLMDEAFVTSMAESGKGGKKQSTQAAVVVESKPTTKPAQGAPSSTPTAKKVDSSDTDAEMAKRMMKAFVSPTNNVKKEGTTGATKKVVDPAPKAVPAAAAATKKAVDPAPKAVPAAAAATKQAVDPAVPAASSNVTPALPSKSTSATPGPVDLDAMFDEFQSTEDVLNDALLDTIVATSAK